MKRSEINRAIERAKAFFERMNIHLPPFAFYPPQTWRELGREVDEIRDNMLGWDVTDFARGDFRNLGRTLFTLRNGNPRNTAYPKIYSEKFIFLEEEQVSPIHYHEKKIEDIINRGGGNVLVRLYAATPDGQKSDEPLEVSVDGHRKTIAAGDTLRLTPGESVYLPTRSIHQFWSEKGTGATVSGEVSSVCDDISDNCFLDEMVRFPSIEEDEPPIHLLCNEYPPVEKEQ